MEEIEDWYWKSREDCQLWQSSRFFYVDAESGISLSAFQSANAFLLPRFHTTPELLEADSVQAIQRRIPGFRLNAFCVHRVVQRDEGGLAQALLAPNDQTAVLQILEDSRGALAAAVELCLCLLQDEVQPNRAVRPGVAVLPGNAGSVQQ